MRGGGVKSVSAVMVMVRGLWSRRAAVMGEVVAATDAMPASRRTRRRRRKMKAMMDVAEVVVAGHSIGGADGNKIRGEGGCGDGDEKHEED